MIYQTGTIVTIAGQTKIKGTGTRWKDNLNGISEGCPISYLINNVVYMNTVLSVNSDTEINLTYPVPVTASAAKYQIATFVLDSMSDGVRKMLANQQYIQYFLRNMDAWMTQEGIVEIKTPTGETVRLDSLVELKKQMDNKLDKTGGTITKNGEALTLKNKSEKQSLWQGFRDLLGNLRGYIGAPNDGDNFSIVNSKTEKALTLGADGDLTYAGKKIGFTNDTAVVSAPMWMVAETGLTGEWCKLAQINGNGGQRYQFILSNTTSGFSSQSNFPAFGVLCVTIGNKSNPTRNFQGSYICTGHDNGQIVPIRIKQLSSSECEIWIRLGSYSKLSCILNTSDPYVRFTNVRTSDVPMLESGDRSVYEIQSSLQFAALTNVGTLDVTRVNSEYLTLLGKGDYTACRLQRLDKTRVDLETSPFNSGGIGNMFNIINRDALGANIAVVGIPNKSGTLTQIGDFGWGGRGEGTAANTDPSGVIETFRTRESRIWRTEVGGSDYVYRYAPNLMYRAGDTFTNISTDIYTAVTKITTGISANTASYKTSTLWGTSNTTVDSQGNIKKASPVIKVFAGHIELNDESEGITLEKISTGRYKLKGTLGMNSDASWGGYNGGIVIPKGINGLELVWADYKVLADGDIIIETHYCKHVDLPPPILLKRLTTYPEFMDEKGNELESYAPCDIPAGHWIDVRVNMPSDSIYNQKLAEADRLAKLEAERLAEEEAKCVAERAEQGTAEREQSKVLEN
ncbi:TPA: hypothetical protein ACS74D_000197 [Providencia alcalifaciens]